MSPALEQALTVIQKGAEERLEVLKSKKSQLEKGESSGAVVSKIIRHIEKVDPMEEDDEPVGGTGEETVAGGSDTAGKETEDQVGGGQMADRETEKEQTGGGQTAGDDDKSQPRKKRSTPSVSKIWEKRHEAVRKEQERRWKEATEKHDTNVPEVDLEEAMMTPEEEDKQEGEKWKEDESEGYRKVYTKTHEKRAERSVSRAEKKAQEEQQKKEEAARKAAKAEADKVAQEEAQRLIERKQLEAEEMAMQKKLDRKRKLQDQADEGETKEGSSSKSLKQQWKEKLGLKATKRRREEEETEEIDDEDNDPDYEPDKDPEQDCVAEDMELNEEDTFEIEKHVHAINLDVGCEYRKLIHFMWEMGLKIGSYCPMEHADEEAVFRTIVDPTCTAWRRALHSAKTGNAKDIQRIEEKQISVFKTVEERKISPKEKMVEMAGEMEESSEEHKKHVKDLIKRYWVHTSKAHEEAAVAASMLQLLADEVDEDVYTNLISAGTRPLIMVHVPQMAKQATAMKLEQEREEQVENLRNTPIEEIIKEQNVPVPVERWVKSSIMIPTQYLAAMVYYFVYAEANPHLTVTNKGVASLFQVSPSNLHKLVSGKKYVGGSQGVGKKASTLKELEEHGEPMVTCTQRKAIKTGSSASTSTTATMTTSKSGGRAGKSKSSSKVTVTKTTPRIIPLPF